MHMQKFKVKKKGPYIVSRPATEKTCVVDYSRNEIYNCWPKLPTFALNLKHKKTTMLPICTKCNTVNSSKCQM